MPLPYISIDNFRAFKEKCEFEFAPITILTGTNSSGKSSLVDAVRVLKNYTEEIPEPDSDKFWGKIFDFKEEYLHDRIPNFKDLVNYHNPDNGICFEFKCRFVGMVELITVSLEFHEKDKEGENKGINGILKSLKYKNEEKFVFCSIEISNDKIHIEIDFGFFYRKFEETMKKEIGISQANLSSANILYYKPVSDTAKTMRYEEYKRLFDVFMPSSIFETALQDCINYENFFELQMTEEIEKLKNLGFQDDDIAKKIMEFVREKSPSISKYDEYKPFYDKTLIENHEVSRIEVLRLETILREKLIIDVDTNYDKDYPYGDILSPFNAPILAILYSDGSKTVGNGSSFAFDNIDIHNFLMKYFTSKDEKNEYYYDNPYASALDTMTPLGQLFYHKFVYANICNAVNEINEQLNFDYIPSQRINPDRLYRKSKGAFFENVLAEFIEKKPLANIEINQFLDKQVGDKHFDIGEEIIVTRFSDYGAYGVYIKKANKKEPINLLDFGYGISQIMPILLKIALTAHEGKTKTIIIEEPETNLHPALQSKLADMFVEASELFHIQFIIETHSEYLIRKLQYLTAKGDIKPEDTQIYYFYHPDSDHLKDGGKQVEKINIDGNGYLSHDFGTGFFDEADKIAMEIWNMNQSQKN